VTPEERFTKLEEAMLVNASLMNRIEQNIDRLEKKAESHEDGIAELRAAQAALIKTMDEFIRGRGSNGHK
jgi:NAD-dependent SIR2 family protein deacetylase